MKTMTMATIAGTMLLLVELGSSSSSAGARTAGGPEGDTNTADALYLAFAPVPAQNPHLAQYNALVSSKGALAVIGAPTKSSAPQSQALKQAATELQAALTILLDRGISVACCSPVEAAGRRVIVNVTGASAGRKVNIRGDTDELGTEGFVLSATSGVRAEHPSGALFGVFRLLALMQQGVALPSSVVSKPAMRLRIWDLWDNLDGGIERGFGGDSIVWPYALGSFERPPPRTMLYLDNCDATDPYQQWEISSDSASTISNAGVAGSCVSPAGSGNPIVMEHPCTSDFTFLFNSTTKQIGVSSALHAGTCFDINRGTGPGLILYKCHSVNDKDYPHQMFDYDTETKSIRGAKSATAKCLSVLNAPPNADGLPSEWSEAAFQKRLEGMLRLLKASGVNGVALNNVNACGNNAQLLESSILKNVTTNLAPAFAKFGMTSYFTACYASPHVLDNVTSDPLSKEAAKWWLDKVGEIYDGFGEESLFGGFLVKADSEGNQGPQAFNTTEADGANLLATALASHGKGGIVMWRAFVYGDADIGKEDRARQAYDTFMPLDGQFRDNVVVQIKNGPMDFQVREPLSPLLMGALKSTNVMMEVQAAQEYTGQQIHAVNLVPQWSYYLNTDSDGNGTTVGDLLSRPGQLTGIAAVSNMGNFRNWTGSVLGASNIYGFGRIGWDPTLTSVTINAEWASMTFAGSSQRAAVAQKVVTQILEPSWQIFEGYTSPMGIGFIVAGGVAGGTCAPKTKGPGPGSDGAECPTSPLEPHASRRSVLGDTAGADHYFVNPCSNYGYSNYSKSGIGCDRTRATTGTGYAGQYTDAVAKVLDDPLRCPHELLLFFHNLPWMWSHPSWKGETMIARIRRQHAEALLGAHAMSAAWDSLKGMLDEHTFTAVQARFAQQLNDANVFSKVILEYYTSLVGEEQA